MSELVTACLQMPTVIYSIFLVVVTIYWLFVVLGAFDIDMIDAEGLFEGGAEGAAEGIAEGAAEGIAEGVAEGIAEGVAEGAAEGIAEGATEGAAEGSSGALRALFSALNLRSVPVTVVFSIIIFLSWLFSLIGDQLFAAWGLTGFLIGLITATFAFTLALPITSVVVRPLGRFFVTHTGRTADDLVGETCEVTTGRVDDKFGQAEAHVGNDHLLIQVRVHKDQGLKRGDEALIVEFDQEHEAYFIEKLKKD